jgi:SAM-dependent methyltransferase
VSASNAAVLPLNPKTLVVVASYGEKNLKFLREMIGNYRKMSLTFDFVVVSEAPKDLGPDVKVVVGLPSKDTWSLPFAHKAVMAENADRYDLFIYTEDDMDVSEGNLRAFLAVTPELADDEIAGYLRYERDQDQKPLLTDVHGAFHWVAESVRRRGRHVFAEFTNEHAGFYVLTRAQLKRALASGGYLVGPYRARYGLPETAATDPYTRCGFRKVICLDLLDDFLIRHMSNLYIHRHGVPRAAFEEQVQALLEIANGVLPGTSLCPVEPKVLQQEWCKSYFEGPDPDLLELLPPRPQSVLSIGCGWGASEQALLPRGASVTVLPLDSVTGSQVARLGIEVVHGELRQSLQALKGRQFEAVMMTNLLHLQADPRQVLAECCRLVGAGGTLLLGGPNFGRFPVRVKRLLRQGDYGKLGDYEASGTSVCGPATFKRQLAEAGLSVSAVRWLDHSRLTGGAGNGRLHLGALTARRWLLRAGKPLAPTSQRTDLKRATESAR